jgi:hypothetical protein
MDVAQDKIVFEMTELKGNIWMMEPVDRGAANGSRYAAAGSRSTSRRAKCAAPA